MFKTYILGGIDPQLFLSCIIFAAIGVFFVLVSGTALRDKNSLNSPVGFSWRYLWSDNNRRVYASVLAVLITIRFLPEVTGIDLNPFRALCVGLFWDGIALLLKQKTSIFDPKK